MAKKVFLREITPKFIVFEGLDGSGQSTQADFLKKFLLKKGIKVVLTKEPTRNSKAGKKIEKILGEEIRAEPKELQKLFAEDRKWHLENVIKPALKANKWVISDRYFFSSFAYGAAEGLNLNWLIKINKGFLYPDLVFLLNVDPRICLKRIEKRGIKKTLFEKKEKLEKIFKIYKTFPNRFRNFVVINGEKTKREVFRDVKEVVHFKFLKK